MDENTSQIHLGTILDQSSGPLLVDCFSPGCAPCAALSPVLDELAVETEGKLTIRKLDLSAFPDIALKFEIRSVPTLLLFKDRQLQAKRTGAIAKAQLMAWLYAQQVL